MRSSSLLAALLIAVLLTAGASHAAYACSVGSSHVGHCGHSHDDHGARPACCQEHATAPLVSRLDSGADHTRAAFAAGPPAIRSADVPAALGKCRPDHPSRVPIERFGRLRLHLVLATLIA
jgi:hypothetical protein